MKNKQLISIVSAGTRSRFAAWTYFLTCLLLLMYATYLLSVGYHLDGKFKYLIFVFVTALIFLCVDSAKKFWAQVVKKRPVIYIENDILHFMNKGKKSISIHEIESIIFEEAGISRRMRIVGKNSIEIVYPLAIVERKSRDIKSTIIEEIGNIVTML